MTDRKYDDMTLAANGVPVRLVEGA